MPQITRPQVYRVVREMLPRERFGPEELLRWLNESQRRNEQASRSHARRRSAAAKAGWSHHPKAVVVVLDAGVWCGLVQAAMGRVWLLMGQVGPGVVYELLDAVQGIGRACVQPRRD